MHRTLIILSATLYFFCGFAAPAFSADMIAKVLTSVVYLRQDVTKTAKINDKEYELWLREPNQNTLQPFIEPQSGSGLFVAVNNQHPYLVTAFHLAAQMTPAAKVVIHGKDDSPIALSLSDLVQRDQLQWIRHDHADVAVLPIQPAKRSVLKQLEKHFLPQNTLARDLMAPPRSKELTIVGFPLNLGVEGKFSPISRSSNPASGLLVLPRFDSNERTTFFLLEDPSAGGFSGSPVFELPDANSPGRQDAKCHGIVHGTISDKTGGKFTAVTPASFVLEVIMKAEKLWSST